MWPQWTLVGDATQADAVCHVVQQRAAPAGCSCTSPASTSSPSVCPHAASTTVRAARRHSSSSRPSCRCQLLLLPLPSNRQWWGCGISQGSLLPLTPLGHWTATADRGAGSGPSESNAFSASIEATAAKRGEAAGVQPQLQQQAGQHRQPPQQHQQLRAGLQDSEALLLDGQLGLLDSDWHLAKSLNNLSVEEDVKESGQAHGQTQQAPRNAGPQGNAPQAAGQRRPEGVRRLAMSGMDLPLPTLDGQQPHKQEQPPHESGASGQPAGEGFLAGCCYCCSSF